MALWRIRATVDDRPGYLSVLTASLALRSVNILSVQVHSTEAGAVDEFLVDAPAELTEADLVAAVAKGRGRDPWVRPADAHGLIDGPTQLLSVAGRLVREPDDLGEVLCAALSGGGPCTVSWTPAPADPGPGRPGEFLAVPDPAGGVFTVHRSAPPFTPAEYARAQALAELAGQLQRRAVGNALLLADGTEAVLRAADLTDLSAVLELHERCSARSRYRRYLTGGPGPSPAALRRLLDTPAGSALLVELVEPGRPSADAGQVIALANLNRDGAEAEVGLLVADSWQRRGLGSTLLRRCAALARQRGIRALHAHTHADNTAMIRTMRRLGLPVRHETDGALITLTAELGTGLLTMPA